MMLGAGAMAWLYGMNNSRNKKSIYANFLGNEIAGYLQSRPGLKVRSVNPYDGCRKHRMYDEW